MTVREWLGGSRRSGASPGARRPALEELEARLAPAGYAVGAPPQVSRDDGLGGAAAREVVFFEPSVSGYAVLRQGLAAGAEAVVLDPAADGLSQMAAFLAGRRDLAAIHVVSHGAPGAVELGAAALDEQALASRAAEVQALAALAPRADLLLWACDP
jgi:hypothetical protein